jgi:hypothetical protein
MIGEYEWERIWKKVVVRKLKCDPGLCLESLRIATKILRKISILADIRTGHLSNIATNVAAYTEVLDPCTFWDNYRHVWSEVITAVVMKSSIFSDIMLSSPLKVNRRFGGTCHRHLHLQAERISRARNQRESRWQAGPLSTTTRGYIQEDRTLQLQIWFYIWNSQTRSI